MKRDVPKQNVKEISSDKSNQPKKQKIIQKYKDIFEQYLPSDKRGIFLPNNISILRNKCIIAVLLQIITSFGCLSFFVFKKSVLYLVANVISLLVSFQGIYGVLTLAKYYVAIHGILTCGILGLFYIYMYLELFFKQNYTEEVPTKGSQFSEFGIFFLMSFPYLLDLIAGVYTFKLSIVLFDFEENQKNQKKNDQTNEIDSDIYEFPEDFDPHSNICCVCFSAKRSTVILPCGHMALCQECAKEVKNRFQPKCPFCRGKIDNIINIYNP